MERRTSKLTTLVVLLSILSVILEFSVYYFTGLVWPAAALTILTSLILSHIFLESSLSYETSFLFSSITMILSTIIIALIYYNQIGGLLVYQKYIHLVPFLHWLVPMAHNILRCLLDKGPRFVCFNLYFWKISTVFAVYYAANLLYHTILDPIMMPYAFLTTSHRFVPFFSTATHIEDFIYMGTGIGEIIIYFLKLFALFGPIGFYSSLFLRDYDKKTSFLIKTGLCLIVPLIFEIIVYFQSGIVNIDAYLYRFFSIFFGILLLKIMDAIFLSVTREKFLHERNRYSFFL